MQTGINTTWAFGIPSHEDGSNIRPVRLTQFFIFFASSRPASRQSLHNRPDGGLHYCFDG